MGQVVPGCGVGDRPWLCNSWHFGGMALLFSQSIPELDQQRVGQRNVNYKSLRNQKQTKAGFTDVHIGYTRLLV